MPYGALPHGLAAKLASGPRGICARSYEKRSQFRGSAETISPVLGLAVLVGNGQHQQVGAVLCVNYAVGKTAQAAAADVRAEGVPCLRKALNELNGFDRFDQERVAQAGRLLCVPRYGFVQLGLCGLFHL